MPAVPWGNMFPAGIEYDPSALTLIRSSLPRRSSVLAAPRCASSVPSVFSLKRDSRLTPSKRAMSAAVPSSGVLPGGVDSGGA
ncbi:hypothetical protein FHR32_001227 [Streptosporangium album]|uniref:Uncharacterized protein n=1 Tax=Streptosporangium album TaxID=47479 RepID=A0A7W7RS75_9ACTN|nr:hypothetical protein [Streptosporangium album]